MTHTYAALAAVRGLAEAVAHARRQLRRLGSTGDAGAFDWLVPSIVADSDPTTPSAVGELLWRLRSGRTSSRELGLALISTSGLEFIDVREPRRVVLPFVLSLFQGFVPEAQWRLFCSLAAQKGWDLTHGQDAIDLLRQELRPAERAGLAIRTQYGYLLHPLATIAIEPGMAATMQVLSGGDSEVARKIALQTWTVYVQSVAVTVRTADALEVVYGPPKLHQQNFLYAVDIALGGEWWGLLFPMLGRLRDALLAEAREAEWLELLDVILRRVRESPPSEEEMGPENAELHITKLLAAEAERHGDRTTLEALRDLQVRIAYATESTLTAVDRPEEPVMDLGRRRRLAAMLQRGDLAAAEGSADCVGFYQEALRLAESEPPDVLLIGEVHLAIARSHVNLSALYDPEQYEFHARHAITAGESMLLVGVHLVTRGSVSLGNAIVEGEQSHSRADPARLREARAAFEKAAGATSPGIGGEARNGLGNVCVLERDDDAAADEYLQACKEFESAGDADGLLAAQVNAARALALVGRKADARSIAATALDRLAPDHRLAPKLVPILAAVLSDAAEG